MGQVELKGIIRGLERKLATILLTTILLVTACGGEGRTPADLDQMAAEMLPRLEVLSGLEARQPISLAWQSRDETQRFIEQQLDEELPPEYIAETRATYAAFGLLPDTLDLRKLLLDLYTEQVVGYYDPATKTLYIVEGTSAGDLQTVLAHELVHALQDQHVDLDSLIARERGNDQQTAAQAAFEGQATLVMFAFMIEEQLGRSITPAEVPPLGNQMQSILEAQNSQFPVFQRAPRFIRETLLFPYIGGATFVQNLWNYTATHGDDAGAPAFTPPIGRFLPESTEQVLHPVEHLLAHRDPPIELEIAPGPQGSRTIHEDNLGELEIGILLRQHLGDGADSAANGWGGDRYRFVELEGGGNAIIWYTIWDTAPAADHFADAYRQILQSRPGRRGRVERTEIEGRPAVLVIDAEESVDPSRINAPPVERLTID